MNRSFTPFPQWKKNFSIYVNNIESISLSISIDFVVGYWSRTVTSETRQRAVPPPHKIYSLCALNVGGFSDFESRFLTILNLDSERFSDFMTILNYTWYIKTFNNAFSLNISLTHPPLPRGKIERILTSQIKLWLWRLPNWPFLLIWIWR